MPPPLQKRARDELIPPPRARTCACFHSRWFGLLPRNSLGYMHLELRNRSIPNVLLIGDSISMGRTVGYGWAAEQMLESVGMASVQHNGGWEGDARYSRLRQEHAQAQRGSSAPRRVGAGFSQRPSALVAVTFLLKFSSAARWRRRRPGAPALEPP